MVRARKVRLSEMTYDDFMDALHYGYKAGWVSDIKCATHDGIPTAPSEEIDWEDGYDPCQSVLRFWGKDGEPKESMEEIFRAEISN